MSVFTILLQEIQRITFKLQQEKYFSDNGNIKQLVQKIVAEPPKDSTHGDIATNVAMILSKEAQLKPRDLAQKYVVELTKNDSVKNVVIAGPGFINITLNNDFWLEQLKILLANHANYGQSNIGKGQKVNIEYVSTNPTGPLHIGHCRVAIVGDIMANLLAKSGYNVTKEYYINDAGGQADALARSTYQRYLQALGHNIEELGSYGGEYLIAVGNKLAQQIQDKYVGLSEDQWLSEVKKFAIAEMMNLIKLDLAKLNIHHDIFTSEVSIVNLGRVSQAIDKLQNSNLIYKGTLDKPKGFDDNEWEAREQLLFKSTQFGDDVDRAIKKSDNSWTYFASDIAYHLDKLQRNHKILINVWGADHGGYVKRLSSAVKAIDENAELKCILCQMVRFVDNGKVLKMSKRSGNFVTVDDAIAKVGVDAMRFMMVSRKNDAFLDFDFEKVIEQTKDNPVFYVQYAYARCHSIKRNILSRFPDINIQYKDLIDLSYSDIYSEDIINLVKKLLEWPRVMELSAKTYETHRITYYLNDLASCFHSLWNKGNDNLNLRFIDDNDKNKTQKNFVFVLAVITVLKSGLGILGITPKEEM